MAVPLDTLNPLHRPLPPEAPFRPAMPPEAPLPMPVQDLAAWAPGSGRPPGAHRTPWLARLFVFGGALGVLLPHDTFWIGFTVVACAVALVGLQTTLLYSGRSIAPFLAVRAQPVAPTVPSARP